MIDYDVVKNWIFEDVRYDYAERDVMLYALGVGLGQDPLDKGQLRYVYEDGLQVMPTMAAIMGAPGAWWKDPRTGADALRLVHGEQHLRFHRPMPAHGSMRVSNRVLSLSDKGTGKGAIGVVLREIRDAETGELHAESRNVSVLRGDGGFSVGHGRTDPPPAPLPPIPQRSADSVLELPTLTQGALIYRLSGDYNPLHADPAVADKAGFARPILHGLVAYGMAAHAVLRDALDYDSIRLRSLGLRFTAPVYPGETLQFELWRESAALIRLRGRVRERDVVAIDNGVVEIDPRTD